MESPAAAALASWSFDAPVVFILFVTSGVYLRGWLRGRRIFPQNDSFSRLGFFIGGVIALFLAEESPLDALDSLYLSAHMTQHLLLMMIAPPLLLSGHPSLPFLRGLPAPFVKEGLGPFLAWPRLQRFLRWIVSPPIAWLVFAISTIGWHLPRFYELALNIPGWHAVQHACFFWTGIIFWWTIYSPNKSKSTRRWIAIPYLLLADMLNTVLSALFIFSDRLLYPSYAPGALRDQQLAGAIMWVPGSLVYLIPAVAIAMRLFSSQRTPLPAILVRIETGPSPQRRIRFWNYRRLAQVTMLGLSCAVMADGFFGTQVSALNLAGTLPWIHWRAFSVFALLVFGNLFCMSCPFVLARDMARKVLPTRYRWPRALRNKWIAAALFLLYLWAYEAFSLWDSPWLTAWVIAAYFGAAIVVDGLFKGASFCKYCCPIGQFHFVTSLVSPREVKVRNITKCRTCQTFDCIRGNSHARGCELNLFQPKKAGNLDCTFCLDCVKACPHDNIAIAPVSPASSILSDPYRSSIGRLSKRTDITAIAVLVVFGAFANAAGMTGPVMMTEHTLHAMLGPSAMPIIVGLFLAASVVLIPALCIGLSSLLNRASGAGLEWRRFTLALVPIGVSMWAAHLFFHLATSWNQSVLVTPIQLLTLDCGILLSLYVIWRLAGTMATRAITQLAISGPWFTVACGLYAAGVWILFQPMQMRGMTH